MSEISIRDNFIIGEKAQLIRTVTKEDVILFAKVSGDHNPLHFNEEFSSKTRFKKPIVHGIFVVSLISSILGTNLPGPGSIYLSQSIKFINPVYIGDTLTVIVEVKNWNDEKKIISLETLCFNQKGKGIVKGEAVLLVETLKF